MVGERQAGECRSDTSNTDVAALTYAHRPFQDHEHTQARYHILNSIEARTSYQRVASSGSFVTKGHPGLTAEKRVRPCAPARHVRATTRLEQRLEQTFESYAVPAIDYSGTGTLVCRLFSQWPIWVCCTAIYQDVIENCVTNVQDPCVSVFCADAAVR